MNPTSVHSNSGALRRIGDEDHEDFFSREVNQSTASTTVAKQSEQRSDLWLSCNRGVVRHADLKRDFVLTERVRPAGASAKPFRG